MPITVNNKACKIPGYDKEIQNLLSLNLLRPQLATSELAPFIDYEEISSAQVLKAKTTCDSQNVIINKLKIVMLILEDQLTPSFVYVVKKSLILHLFIHLAGARGFLNEAVSEEISHFLREVLDRDMPVLTRPSCLPTQETGKKKENSLSKLYNAIRSLSGSKKQKSSKSKLKIEETNEKGAIKEVIQKIVAPFVCYMLKLSQDYQAYNLILCRSIPPEAWEAFKWKMFNYMTHLGKIVVELNRLAKYYREELLGTWLLLSYCISKDTYSYYDLLAEDINSRCQQYKEKLFLIQKYSRISRRYTANIEELLTSPKMQELKAEVDMLMEVREKFLYIYYNAALKNWCHLMRKPKAISNSNAKTETIEFILDLYERYADKLQKKAFRTLRQGGEGETSKIRVKTELMNPEQSKTKPLLPPKPLHAREKQLQTIPTGASTLSSHREPQQSQSRGVGSILFAKNIAMGA